MNLHVATKRKSRTGEEYERLLRLDVSPAIGARRVLDCAARNRSASWRRWPGRRAPPIMRLALVSAIWNWAARRDEVAAADNPAKGIERYPSKAANAS